MWLFEGLQGSFDLLWKYLTQVGKCAADNEIKGGGWGGRLALTPFRSKTQVRSHPYVI
jgi:hypothetical protein